MKHTDTRGFTLIELLVVVLIIGILASIAVPQYKMAVHKARIRSYMPVLRDLAEAEELFYMVNGRYGDTTHDREALDISFPKECKINSTDNWRLNCGNHVTLVTYGDHEGANIPIAVGLLYCYDGSQPCGDNQDIQILKVFQNQYEGSPTEQVPGKWGCKVMKANDNFGKKLCSIWNS